MEWYRNDKAAVAEALRGGERPDLATTMASGPLDELVALHQELGIFAIVEELEVQRTRAGIADELLLRTLATLPFVEQASLSGASEVLCRGVRMVACASRRGAVALSTAVGARQGLRHRWQRVGQRFPSSGPGVCLSHPSDHRGLAALEWTCLGERQRSGGDALAD